MLSSDRYNCSGLTCHRMVAVLKTNTHTATSNSTDAVAVQSHGGLDGFSESGSLNIGVCNLTEGILGGWRDGEEGEASSCRACQLAVISLEVLQRSWMEIQCS